MVSTDYYGGMIIINWLITEDMDLILNCGHTNNFYKV